MKTLRTPHLLITTCMVNSDFKIKIIIICWHIHKPPHINTETCILHIPFKLFACIDYGRHLKFERANKWLFKIIKMWAADFICYNDIFIGIFTLTFLPVFINFTILHFTNF